MKTRKTPVLSLDIWDTILRRTCHPDELKLYTAQRMLFLLSPYIQDHPKTPTIELLRDRRKVEYTIGKREQDNGFDDEYEIEEVLSRCIDNIAQDRVDESTKRQILGELVNAEIEQEIHVTYLDQDLIRLIDSIEYEKLIIVSDFYMSWEKIDRILKANSFPFKISHYFISCDAKLNKRSGRLFSHICSELHVKPDSILHLGDNEHSDVLMPKDSGMSSHFFTDTPEFYEKVNKEQLFHVRCTHKSIDHLEKLFLKHLNTAIEPYTGPNPELYYFGVRLSLLFVGFSLFILEKCVQREHTQVHFFTREGKFFKEIFDKVLEYNSYRLPPVKSYLLPVSRLATFFPSLREISCLELQRLWSQYTTQSMTALFRSLDIASSDYTHFLEKHEIGLDTPIREPWQNNKIEQLFSDNDFLTQINEEQKGRKTILKDFFSSLEFGNDGKALIVDIGWRGSIQDNLAHIYPEIDIDGIYLALQDFYNPQPKNTCKYGYIADQNKGHNNEHPLLLHVRPFEMLCNVTGGSACGYTKDQYGVITPVYQCDGDEDSIHTRYTTHFQEGVMSGVGKACELIRQHGISVEELRLISVYLAEQLINDPPKEVCKAYFSLKHNETFGVGDYIHPEDSFRMSDLILGYIMPSKRHKFLKSLELSGWPQGLLKYQYGGLAHYLRKFKKTLAN